ncbi:sodium/glutamate symporter [Bradyrhizobium sp. Arg314]
MKTLGSYSFNELQTLVVALVALIVGKALRAKLPPLQRIDLPDAVVGGLVAAVSVLAIRFAFGVELTFGNHLRDLLLLMFFSTIGLSAKLRLLKSGGKPLLILCLVTVVLIVLQNLVGATVALAWGTHPFYGLLAGSLSFIGGPGTAMAWAQEAEAAGLAVARPVGIAAATLAVVAGALLAGPLVGLLIKRKGLKANDEAGAPAAALPQAEPTKTMDSTVSSALTALLAIAVSVLIGEEINTWSRSNGVMLPGFLCTLLAGILITNSLDAFRMHIEVKPVAIGGAVALNLFLAMSLTATPLAAMFSMIVPLTVNVLCQILVIVCVAYYILFPLLGRDYDAAVTTAGFLGFGIASMPVAMATMEEITKRSGPSPRAVLTVTLAGAFFVDLANALVAKLFLLLPLFGMG